MNIRQFMVSAVILFSTATAAFTQSAEKKAEDERIKPRPNIIFILADDHRWDAFGCMNHPFIDTPNLDALAEGGILFSNSFCTTSLCSPSRASFLTGEYPHIHGVTTNHTIWDEEQNTSFLEILHDNGYETAFIGKWHMPGEGVPEVDGIDRFITFTAQGGQGVYENCPLIIDGAEEERPGKYITEDLTDFALEFIEKERSQPFCLYLSHKAAHFGFLPPKHLRGTFDDTDLQLPQEADPLLTITRDNLFVGAPAPLPFLYQRYCETILSLDEQVGRIIESLKESGMDENTLVIYAGDNGHYFGEHGLYDKRSAYEESIRIPFFAWGPGIIDNPGRRVDDMLLNIDLAPTLLDLVGLPVPENMQGVSVLPILQDRPMTTRSAWLYEHFPVYPIPIPGITAVRTDRYIYITYQNNKKRPEIFDLLEDPGQYHNLYGTPEGDELLPMLRSELERVKAETGYIDTF